MLASEGSNALFYRLAQDINSDIMRACQDGRLKCVRKSAIPSSVSGLNPGQAFRTPKFQTSISPIGSSLLTFAGSDSERPSQSNPNSSDLRIWGTAIAWYSTSNFFSTPLLERLTSTIVEALRYLFTVTVSVLLIPAVFGLLLGLKIPSLRPYLFLTLGSLSGVLAQLAVLTLLEENVGGYRKASAGYFLTTSALMLIFVTSGTYLFFGVAGRYWGGFFKASRTHTQATEARTQPDA